MQLCSCEYTDNLRSSIRWSQYWLSVKIKQPSQATVHVLSVLTSRPERWLESHNDMEQGSPVMAADNVATSGQRACKPVTAGCSAEGPERIKDTCTRVKKEPSDGYGCRNTDQLSLKTE